MALETIIAHKREEVARRKAALPLEAFRDGLARSTRSLGAALRAKRTGFVMECKKASPSRGLIRPDFDVEAIARCYARYADAISVLADERFFEGSLEFIRAVSEAVDLPVLCKDFTLEPYQVYEARLYGADAVLLMMSVLDDAMVARCLDAAKALGVDALTEVHDEAELERALGLGAEIIGINNRNLKTLEVDLETSRRLAPLVPRDRVVVVESGISSHSEVVSLRDQCHAFLVGSSLMSEPDLDAACRRLVYGRVKVCGLTRPEDARAVFDAGGSFGGLIFAEKSPRCVSLEQARAVREGSPLEWVGVFVDAPVDVVAEHAAALDLAAVQLHGDEDAAYMEALRPLLKDAVEIWKVVRVAGERPVLEIPPADRVLLDTASPRARGGTGETFDWDLVDRAAMGRAILAGGLDPGNAAAADKLGAWALDANSGVEEAPGIKSSERIARFFDVLRG
jgi:indole-3-glycerol phosphate synthase/phosphoribosylanthranilate isomerase